MGSKLLGILPGLVVAAAFWAFLLWPWDARDRVVRIQAVSDSAPSETKTEHFHLARDAALYCRYWRHGKGDVVFSLRDAGGELPLQFRVPSGPRNDFGIKLRAGDYAASLVETGSTGSCTVELWSRRGLDFGQRMMLTLAGLLGCSALVFGAGLLKPGLRRGRAHAAARYVLVISSLALCATVVYPLVHELGHAAPLAGFGVLDLRKCDFIGIHGRPHVGRTLHEPLAPPWKEWLVSAGGLLLPTFLAWGLFALWRCTRLRGYLRKRLYLRALYMITVGVLVLPQFVTAAALTGLFTDNDLRTFYGAFPLPPRAAAAVVIALTLVSACVFATVLRELWKARGEIRSGLRIHTATPCGPASRFSQVSSKGASPGDDARSG